MVETWSGIKIKTIVLQTICLNFHFVSLILQYIATLDGRIKQLEESDRYVVTVK